MSSPARNRLAAQWLPSVALAVLALALFTAEPRGVVSVVVLIVLLALAVTTSPLIFPRSRTDREARELGHARTLIYWRPGCSYCVRLRLALGLRGNAAVWVDVSRDPAASERVRGVNGGNETVPTVFVGDVVRTNPSPTWVRSTLRPSPRT
ncbi:glutaredoxin domain-containing protein [Nocardioides terrisoli]|uniref:glutaredoxin domain-containing protein n=1 Tax=Nocardioides terrisoli TaxID=3388267 RepID=UPI00287B78CE|nr:glutaredoxin domain-containing protein [Nocardioides marmorisolisilvae]